MTELIIDQYIRSKENKKNNDSRLFTKHFRKSDYDIDILSTRYYQNNSNSTDAFSITNEELQKSSSIFRDSNSILSSNQSNEKISPIHSIPIKLPDIVEMQLRHNKLLKDTIKKYRCQERYSNVSKSTKISLTKPEVKEDILKITSNCLCPTENRPTSHSEVHLPLQSKDQFKTMIETILDSIFTEEIIYENRLNEIQQNNQRNQFHKQLKNKKKKTNHIMQILPYQNTYAHVYYPNEFISIDKTMIDKIIHGVQAMGTALINSRDIEDVLNGRMIINDQTIHNKISDELMNILQKRFLTRTETTVTTLEQIHYRIGLNLILADNRLNGQTILCRSQTLILSCMLEKIRLCIQMRSLCSANDILMIITENDSQQIHLRSIEHLSLSFDEFIEILGEIYHTSSKQFQTLNTYFQANDVMDLDTHLVYSFKLDDLDQLTKYILHEDAIRQVVQMIFSRKQNQQLNDYTQLKLTLPTKLNDLYQPIKKLNTFMSSDQVIAALKKPYLSQLTQRAQSKTITVHDLRSISSQIWLSSEDFQTLISNQTITADLLCQFYLDFHERHDIDNRFNQIQTKLFEYLNSHSCLTRVRLNMLIEHSHGTDLSYFLDEFNRAPRFLSIVELFDDVYQSGLISTTELLLFSKQEIIVKKSSLLKHFQRISFIRKHDVDLLAEMSLIIREDEFIELLRNRAKQMKEEYIHCILNTDERRKFLETTNKLSSVSIHQFIHRFNLNPICGKIFYWMGLADENIVKTLIEIKTFVNEYTLDGIYENFLTRLHDTLESEIYYLSAENISSVPQTTEELCKLGCYLTYEQALILVDFADPQYEHELSSLITIHDIIPYKNRNDSSSIIHKQEVIECKVLLESFHQRILFRQKRFQRIENLQKLLLSSILFDYFIEYISQLGSEYFIRIELDYLEETKLIDIGVLAILLTLPTYNPLIHQHKYSYFRNLDQQQDSNLSSNYLHILDPIIDKYSIFLTTILLRILSEKERFSSINEILLTNPTIYLSIEEVLQISHHEQILSFNDIQRICQETFPSTRFQSDSIIDCYQQNIQIYRNNSNLQKRFEQIMILNIFDTILHLNNQIKISKQLKQLFRLFKPLTIYTSQLLIEKEFQLIKLFLQIRKTYFQSLTINDLNKYLQSYPIPCRLDILNDLRRLKFISQSLTDQYTLLQCQELKSSSPDIQIFFIFYMFIKLIRNEGYIDEDNLRKSEKINDIYENGYLTIEQIIQSIHAFFLQDYVNDETIRRQLSEYKNVIEQAVLNQNKLTNVSMEHFRRRQVIQIKDLHQQLKSIKISKEKLQRKVENVLLKTEDNSIMKHSRLSNENEQQQQSILNLRSLRHHYLQAKIAPNQLRFLVEQGGWNEDIYLQFQHELDIIHSNNSLDLIRYLTKTISILLQENGSIAQQPLNKYFRYHRILFHADFELLLTRYGMVDLDDLIDLLVVSKLARAEEIKSYAKKIFCLNVNKFHDISKSQDDNLVKKSHVENNLEKKLCITSTDLAQLLNHFLKLDRLKHLIDIMPTIQNYLHLHPINTFNAVKALKLEFNFNHHDMKFLRDLNILNDTWYKRYLLSRISDTGPIVTEIIDEEQEQDDKQEIQFRTSTDEEFDFEAFNELFQKKDSQSNISEQRKQTYLEEIQKRKDQLDSHKSKLSIEEDQTEFAVDLNEIQKENKSQRKPTGVIEQFFPLASILGPQLLVPYSYEQQERLFFEMDFAKEEIIEDTVEDKPIIAKSLSEEKQLSLIKKIPSEKERISIEDQSIEISDNKDEKDLVEIKQQVNQTPNKQESIEKRASETTKSREDVKTTETIPVKDEIVEEKSTEIIVEDEINVPSIKKSTSNQVVESMTLIDKTVSLSKCTSIVVPYTTKELTKKLSESLHQISDSERNSFKKNIELAQHNIDQWLQRTLQYNEQINATETYSDAQFQLTNELINYLQNELDSFDKTFISSTLTEQLKDFELANRLKQRVNQIEYILEEKKNHQKIIGDIQQQVNELDQMINQIKNDSDKEQLLNKLNRDRNKFNQLKSREYLQIQPILGARLELAIRTLDADLQLIEQIFHGKSIPETTTSMTSLVTKKASRQPLQSVEDQVYENMTTIRKSLANVAMDIKSYQQKINEKKIPDDLLKKDMNERLEAIKREYSQLKINDETLRDVRENIDKLDDQSSKSTDKLKEIQHVLKTQTDQIQKNLKNITIARQHSNHPNIPFDSKLKYLPVDSSGASIEPAIYLVNEQNRPVSDQLKLIRMPIESDQFQISSDQHELIIIDRNQIPISDPITFQQLPIKSIKFEYINDEHQSVQVLDHSSDQSHVVNIKSIAPSDSTSTNQALFIVDKNDHSFFKPIQLINNKTPSTFDLSELKLGTFLYDEKSNDKVLLTSEQYLIAQQQAEFTPRKFLTYILDQENRPISEPIEILDSNIQMKYSVENMVSKKLDLISKKRKETSDHVHLSANISDEYELLHGYILDRMDKLQIEENIIEHIVPILNKQLDDISAEQLEYKQAQSHMDYLLNTMKSIIQLDNQLTEYRKNPTRERSEIQKLETNLINQLIEVSTQLDDLSIYQRVQLLSSQLKNTSLLTELRPVVLSGIKTRAKLIQKQCENLLINIYEKSNQLKQPEQIRFEYVQYLTKRFNEESEYERNMENSYEKIERMQYEFYQKMADGSETITLEDLDDVIKNHSDLNQLSIPDNFKTKNEQLIYRFNQILRYFQDELIRTDQYKTVIFDEMEGFLIEPIHSDYSYIQQILFLQNQIQISKNENLLKLIEKFKILLNKFETVDKDNLQYDYLCSRLDHLYDIFRTNYQIELPVKTEIDSVRMLLNDIRKKTRKQLDEYEISKNDLLRKLEVLKKKEELKQRTTTTSITEESRLNLLNAFIQQSKLEPINIHHEYYAMKIQQLTKDLIALFQKQTIEQDFPLRKTLKHTKSYLEYLDKQKLEYEDKLETFLDARRYLVMDNFAREKIEDLVKQQKKFMHEQESIIKMQTILNETLNELQVFLRPNVEQEKSQNSFQQLKQRAIEIASQLAEYKRLAKYVSAQLLISNQITSGQELISMIAPSFRSLIQLPIETHIEKEDVPETYLLKPQSSNMVRQIQPTDFKTQILQTEIDYLEQQHAEAVTNGDLTQQIAAERAISNKLQMLRHLQPKQEPAQIEIQKSVTHDQPKIIEEKKPKIPSLPRKIKEKSLVANQIDQQIRGLMKKQVKQLQKRLQETSSRDQQKEILHFVEDLRELNDKLKKSRKEKNRQNQIDIQLQILDKINQLDRDTVDQNRLENLREHLHEEKQQGLLIQSSSGQSHRDGRTQILPAEPQHLDSSFIANVGEQKSLVVSEQTMMPVTGEVIVHEDSKEPVNTALVTTDTKKLYNELEKIKYSMELALENFQQPSDVTERKRSLQIPTPMKTGISIEYDADQSKTIRLSDKSYVESSSIVTSDSALIPATSTPDSVLAVSPENIVTTPDQKEQLSSRSSLVVVGNAKKYSLTQTKAKEQQIEKLAQQSISQLQREYGDVYIRHKYPDQEKEKSQDNLTEKIKRKSRLVKFEKTRQGSAVIHHLMNLSARTLTIPYKAIYEENLQPVPPLIQVDNREDTIPTETVPITLKPKQSPTILPPIVEQQSEKTEITVPTHSVPVLSPIEEDLEEIEPTDGIAFKLIIEDSQTKQRFINEKDRISDLLPVDDEKKQSGNTSIEQRSSTIVTSHPVPATESTIEQIKKSLDKPNAVTMSSPSPSPSSSPDVLPAISNISNIKHSAKSSKSKKGKTKRRRSKSSPVKQVENVPFISPTTPDEILSSTEPFEIEQSSPRSTVVYHKVGSKSRSGKKSKKKKKKSDKSKDQSIKKMKKTDRSPEPEPLVVTPRKAVPFISATKDKQIDVEDDRPTKQKRSAKSKRKTTSRSKSSGRSSSRTQKKKKKTTKRQQRKELLTETKPNHQLLEPKSIKNRDAIALHLLDVKRFADPPISPIHLDQSRLQYENIIEIPSKSIEQSRMTSLKPMIKNFEFENIPLKHHIQNVNTYQLSKELYDFNKDTKDIEQPAMFNEYIPDFFQKQAEEKQIRRISLTAIRTDEHLTKRLAPRVPRLYTGWQPSDQKSAHTKEFRPLNKYLMTDLSYYFDDDFIDESGLFQNQKQIDKISTQFKQPTQRFRDDYIIKEYFNCWKNSTAEKARIAELRRKRVMIDFREFWFQDAFSDPFYSYFDQPADYRKKQNDDHQMAYRRHKRLVRTGREQPKETMNYQNRSSFLPLIFNLPKTYLDRQDSLTHRYRSIDDSILLRTFLTNRDELLPLIRERIRQRNISINLHHAELEIQQYLLNNSLFEHGTIKDIDRFIDEYVLSNQTISKDLVKLPMIKRSSSMEISK